MARGLPTGIKQSETQIQAAICDYLSLQMRLGKLMFWRSNNTPVFDKTHGAFRALPKHTMKGIPDIIVIKDGYFIGLEVKKKGGYQSPDQKEFERLCKENGAEYHVVRSIDEVAELGL